MFQILISTGIFTNLFYHITKLNCVIIYADFNQEIKYNMRKTGKILSCIIPICFLSCFLMGCPSPNDESKQAEEHVSQAIPIIEEEVMMNVITKDIYVSSEWYMINSFAKESVT